MTPCIPEAMTPPIVKSFSLWLEREKGRIYRAGFKAGLKAGRTRTRVTTPHQAMLMVRQARKKGIEIGAERARKRFAKLQARKP